MLAQPERPGLRVGLAGTAWPSPGDGAVRLSVEFTLPSPVFQELDLILHDTDMLRICCLNQLEKTEAVFSECALGLCENHQGLSILSK